QRTHLRCRIRLADGRWRMETRQRALDAGAVVPTPTSNNCRRRPVAPLRCARGRGFRPVSRRGLLPRRELPEHVVEQATVVGEDARFCEALPRARPNALALRARAGLPPWQSTRPIAAPRAAGARSGAGRRGGCGAAGG